MPTAALDFAAADCERYSRWKFAAPTSFHLFLGSSPPTSPVPRFRHAPLLTPWSRRQAGTCPGDGGIHGVDTAHGMYYNLVLVVPRSGVSLRIPMSRVVMLWPRVRATSGNAALLVRVSIVVLDLRLGCCIAATRGGLTVGCVYRRVALR